MRIHVVSWVPRGEGYATLFDGALGVYDSREKAEAEKKRLEGIARAKMDENDAIAERARAAGMKSWTEVPPMHNLDEGAYDIETFILNEQYT